MKSVVAITGPTASGKTRLAIHLAHKFDGEIINVDSRLFYRGFDIGTAKPSESVRSAVIHHLVDICDPDEIFTLAQFLTTANQIIDDILSREKLPILSGGTGQYFWGLLEGWQVPRIQPDKRLRLELEETVRTKGLDILVNELREASPVNLPNIDVKNPRRVIRAVERVRAGMKENSHTRASTLPYDACIIGIHIERVHLHRLVRERILKMIRNGWIEEVRRLLNSNVKEDAQGMYAIGYREIVAYLRGDANMEDTIEKICRSTNRLVRSQANWSKKSDPRIHWVPGVPGENTDTVSEAVRLVGEWLKARRFHVDLNE